MALKSSLKEYSINTFKRKKNYQFTKKKKEKNKPNENISHLLALN